MKAMCNALGVGEGALVHADMLSYQEMFYALFDMEDFHGLHPVKKEDGYYLRFGSDSIINDFLEEWYKMYQNIQDQEEMMKKKNIHSAVMNIQMRSQWYRSMNY
ncbi:hypothetical protein NIA73_01230 [Anaerobutyricum hallii]|nr:hypothetical protein [Anaerobutyricum hallii]